MPRRDPSRCDWCHGRRGGCNYCPTVPESPEEVMDELMDRLHDGSAEFFVITDGYRVMVPPEFVSISVPRERTKRAAICSHEFQFIPGSTTRKQCLHCKTVMTFRFTPEDPKRQGAWIFEDLERLFSNQTPAPAKKPARRKRS